MIPARDFFHLQIQLCGAVQSPERMAERHKKQNPKLSRRQLKQFDRLFNEFQAMSESLKATVLVSTYLTWLLNSMIFRENGNIYEKPSKY